MAGIWIVWVLACGSAAPAVPAPQATAPGPALRTVEWPPGDEPRPTVILVHGLGDTPEGILPLLQAYPRPIRVVAPAGPLAYGDGRSWFDLSPQGGLPDDLPARLRADAELVADLIRHLRGTGRVAGKPVITGFSQGGMLSFAVAALHPELVAGAAPIGGLLPAELVPARCAGPVPIRALHGEADARLPVDLPRRAVEGLVAAGCDARLQTWPGVGHEVSPDMQRALYAELDRLLPR